MIPPPKFDDLQQAQEWCYSLWKHYVYPDSFQPNFIELKEETAPSAPEDGRGRIYLADAGAGLSQFLIIFPTGDPIRLAIEAGTAPIESTDDLTEGATNLYFTDARTVAAVSGNWPYLLQADADGNVTLNVETTDAVSDPPTEAELDAIWASPSDGFQAWLWDSTNTKMYLVVYDGTNSDWYYVLMTKVA